ncbi:HAD family hydrolase [uncultured Muribaculum sp.]|uniref:haloacid dehalogenase-like hydrolase n=1 Tax=uncultured Muribaculum sp. TaxID=1918613 RepID=UPI0025D88276|nr:HAD family hydrolase [uncultured Muribaculum sp.]
MIRKAIAIDLDNTLCNLNTFNIYIKYLLKEYSIRPLLFSELVLWILARKFRMVSHASMKHHILARFTPISPKTLNKLVETVYTNKNMQVCDILEISKQDNFITILATAAPEAYAKDIAKRFGFDFCVATPNPAKGEKWYETRGLMKLNHVIQLSEKYSFIIDLAISDHDDDTPLLRAATKAMLVDTNNKNLIPLKF